MSNNKFRNGKLPVKVKLPKFDTFEEAKAAAIKASPTYPPKPFKYRLRGVDKPQMLVFSEPPKPRPVKPEETTQPTVQEPETIMLRGDKVHVIEASPKQ